MTGNVLLPGCRELRWEPGEDYVKAGGLWLPPSAADEAEDLLPATYEGVPTAVSLFTGAGGFDCGFHQAGWHTLAANEYEAAAAHTYLVNMGSPDTRIEFCTDEDEARWKGYCNRATRRRNKAAGFDRPWGEGWIKNQPDGCERACRVFYFGDVRALTGARIKADLGVDTIGCVFGGPPCQGFSRAGKQNPDDPRNELVFEFMRVVTEIQPLTFCMENVPGIVDMVTKEGIPVLDALAMMAAEGGMGTFEALRQTLAETAGVGAAVRGSKRPGRGGRDEVEAELPEDEQLGLFA